MRAALRNSYVGFVIYMGENKGAYPMWFLRQMRDPSFKYTFYIPKELRTPDYYDKTVVSYGDVFVQKANGFSFLITDDSIFQDFYHVFDFDIEDNSGVAAFVEDCIEYVECQGGFVVDDKPDWFYEHFTEAVNFPDYESYILIGEGEDFDVTEHCVFLQNRFGEIRAMRYADFFVHYDPDQHWGLLV